MRALLVAGILAFSALTVYTQYVFLHTTDHVTNRPFREASLDQYREILGGTRPFPYQWRVAGPWIVRLGEVATGRDPHVIDLVVKVIALAASALLLFAFTTLWATRLAAVMAAAFYFALTAAAYSSEGYSIYCTNDFLLVAGWFAAVYLAARGRFGWAALATFLTAWAKETAVLVPLLVGLGWWRGRARFVDVLIIALAFAVPTAILRVHYPAPLHDWAWWGNVTLNIPLLRPERSYVWMAIRDNLKIALLFNVLWIFAYLGWRRTTNPFLRELAIVGVLYTALLYVVVVIRELRHFLPLAIVVIPLAVSEIEARLQDAAPSRGRELDVHV